MKVQDGNRRAVGRQRRRRRRLILAAVGLFVAAGVGYLGWNLGWTAAAEGDPAPPFVLPDHQGRQVALVFYMTYG